MNHSGPSPQTIPVVLPDLRTTGVRVSLWFAEPGDLVFAGDRLVEVFVGGATFDVAAPVTGRLAERRAWPPELVEPNQVLGLVEVEPE